MVTLIYIKKFILHLLPLINKRYLPLKIIKYKIHFVMNLIFKIIYKDVDGEVALH